MTHKVRVTVHAITRGRCPGGYKVGDSWLIENGRTPEKICGDAFTSIYPAIRLLWLGESQPWDNEPDTTYRSSQGRQCVGQQEQGDKFPVSDPGFVHGPFTLSIFR